MKHYVTGFMFSKDKTKVVLIEKQRPDWQKGKLNGIGGHIEDGETALNAMIREFEEEAGIKNINWDEFMMMGCDSDNNSWDNIFFRCFVEDDIILSAKSMTDELVSVVYVNKIDSLNLLNNIKWLIFLSLDDEPTFTKTSY